MKWPVLALCIICSFLFLYNTQSRDFWAPDEGDFAEIARETEYHPVVPHLNNSPYGEKPPLFYYITYGSHRALPFLRDETSMRIPTALLAAGCAIFFFAVVRRFFGIKESMISVTILITAPLYYWQARYLQVDMVFAVFTASAMLSFFRFSRDGSRAFYYLFFVFTALAFMTKGPLSIALTFPAIAIYLLFRKDFSLVRQKETYIGLLILAAIVLPWYAAVYCWEGFPYLYENIIRQNFLRFADAWSHKRPFYYYLTTLPMDFFPWSLFLPMGVYLCMTNLREKPKTAYFLIWSAWMFLFLSLSSGKISKYMLPLFPAISLIAGSVFLEERSKYRNGVFFFLSMLFFALGWLLFLYRPGWYPQFYPERLCIGIFSLAASLALAFYTWKKKPFHAFAAVALFMVLCYGTANASIYGKFNPYKSPKRVAEKMKPYIIGGTPWVYYGSMRGVYVYYAGAYATHVDEHDTKKLIALGRELKSFFILTRKRDMNEVTAALPGVRPQFEERIGETVMVFSRYDRDVTP